MYGMVWHAEPEHNNMLRMSGALVAKGSSVSRGGSLFHDVPVSRRRTGGAVVLGGPKTFCWVLSRWCPGHPGTPPPGVLLPFQAVVGCVPARGLKHRFPKGPNVRGAAMAWAEGWPHDAAKG